MSKTTDTIALISKFIAGGVINTAIGLSVIFLMMLLGAGPITANICGYAVGFVLSFTLNRQLVFLGRSRVSTELTRFSLAFGLSYLANLTSLHISLSVFAMNPFVAQLLSAAVYTCVMFALCKAFVFTNRGSALQEPRSQTRVP
jgi:putative flippase GtrA